jgi:outer membrane protein OmpA-like peptidoglycan-associated protein
VKELIGPASDIKIYATRDALTSTFVVPTLLKPSKPQVIGIVYFDTAKSKIRPDAAREIKRLATLIKKLGYKEIVISGHTDARAFDNLTLSNKRALASKTALAKLVSGLAFDLKYSGAKEPMASNATVSGQQANRRAEIAVW